MPHLWQKTYKCSNGSRKIEMTLNSRSQPHDEVKVLINLLLESQNKQRKAFASKVTVSEKAQEATCLVAELIVQKRRKSHSW
jgi:hypothetical protein